jgi:hypothetical protein
VIFFNTAAKVVSGSKFVLSPPCGELALGVTNKAVQLTFVVVELPDKCAMPDQPVWVRASCAPELRLLGCLIERETGAEPLS